MNIPVKISDYKGYLISGGLALIVFPWGINLICAPTYGEWVGFLGNYIGALIGGIMGALVAYFIARQQIEELKKQEIEKKYLEQYGAVSPLLIGLELIEKGYHAIVNAKKANENPALSEFYGLIDISGQAWDRIYLLTDINLQNDLLRAKNQYLSDYQSMMMSCIGLLKESNEYKKEKETSRQKDNSSTEDSLAIGEENIRQMLIELISGNKRITYHNAENNLGKIANLKTKLNNLSENIEKRLNKTR